MTSRGITRHAARLGLAGLARHASTLALDRAQLGLRRGSGLDLPVPLGNRSLASKVDYPNPEVVQQLQAIRELKTRMNDVSRPNEKQELIKEYPQLREILET